MRGSRAGDLALVVALLAGWSDTACWWAGWCTCHMGPDEASSICLSWNHWVSFVQAAASLSSDVLSGTALQHRGSNGRRRFRRARLDVLASSAPSYPLMTISDPPRDKKPWPGSPGLLAPSPHGLVTSAHHQRRSQTRRCVEQLPPVPWVPTRAGGPEARTVWAWGLHPENRTKHLVPRFAVTDRPQEEHPDGFGSAGEHNAMVPQVHLPVRRGLTPLRHGQEGVSTHLLPPGQVGAWAGPAKCVV